jgi:DNA-binding response OmpR family regulator
MPPDVKSSPIATAAKQGTPFLGPGYDALSVLLVSHCEETAHQLQAIFRKRHWKMFVVPTYRAALDFLTKERVPVIISEFTLPDAAWKDILSQTVLFPEPPSVLVLAAATQASLSTDILNSGAFAVLVVPFDESEVNRIVTSAWVSFQRNSRLSLSPPKRSQRHGAAAV